MVFTVEWLQKEGKIVLNAIIAQRICCLTSFCFESAAGMIVQKRSCPCGSLSHWNN